jgi:hypothetical protein
VVIIFPWKVWNIQFFISLLADASTIQKGLTHILQVTRIQKKEQTRAFRRKEWMCNNLVKPDI